MVIAATLAMIIGMTYRLSFAFQGAIVTLLITRETVRSAVQSAGIAILATALGTLAIIATASFAISIPFLHFLCNIVLFFLAFFALSTLTSYAAVSVFAFTIALAVPLWDRHVSGSGWDLCRSRAPPQNRSSGAGRKGRRSHLHSSGTHANGRGRAASIPRRFRTHYSPREPCPMPVR
jgi:hypothetical protein